MKLADPEREIKGDSEMWKDGCSWSEVQFYPIIFFTLTSEIGNPGGKCVVSRRLGDAKMS